MKIKKGDTIKVLMGRDKDKTGKVEAVHPSRDEVIVPGINEYKRHVKSRAQNQKSEIMTLTKAIAASKVALICPKCKKPTRVGFQLSKAGKKVRICKKCKKEIE